MTVAVENILVKDYSQCGEAGILLELLRKLQQRSGWAVEFGAGNGAMVPLEARRVQHVPRLLQGYGRTGRLWLWAMRRFVRSRRWRATTEGKTWR